MGYAIITENDESDWKDKTGELYHFPKKYLSVLQPGTKVIYYKGKLNKSKYREFRLTKQPHYFGIAEIGESYKDSNSQKNDYFAHINNFTAFSKPVLIKKNDSEYIEAIPLNKGKNYWRDGARRISKEVYDEIISYSDLENEYRASNLNDIEQGKETSLETELIEGGQRQRYTTFYERNSKLREKALLFHGYSCKGCGFNFEKFYGEVGSGFIHVHHLKPISESVECVVNPKEDLTVLCANCHAIVHRKRNNILSIEDLQKIIKVVKKK